MKVRGALSFVAFAVIAVFAFAYFTSLGVRFSPSSQRNNMSMEVPDINGLVVGSSVQLRGVPIGEISSVSTTIAGATVNFYIDRRYQIPIDSDIRLESLSALGEAYIELVPRREGGPVLQDGQRLAAVAITQPPSISELATTVVRVLNQLQPGALEHINDEISAALPSPATVLPNLSRTATLLRNTAAAMHGKGRDLLENFQALFRNADFVGPVLAFNAPYVTLIGHELRGLFSCLVEGTNLGAPQTLRNLGHFIGRVEHLLDHSGGDIKVLLQAMLPYLNDVSGALMNLDTGQVLRNMLAAVPEDGAVTLHVTIPDAGVPDNPEAGVPTTRAAPPPAVAAPTTAPKGTPTPPVVPECKEIYLTPNAAAASAPATPRTPAARPPGN